jgi:hypothetical protein
MPKQSLTFREMYALLFEPPNGWHDQAELDGDFAVYEAVRARYGAVTPDALAHAFTHQAERLNHIQALGEHLRAHPRESDARPDSSD